MIPFIVLVASLLVFRAFGALGLPFFGSWVISLRWALAVMFLLTASAHFGKRRPDLVRMVPPRVPSPELLVTLTGLAEIAGAAGLLVPRVASFAAGGLALLLVAVFPANVHAAKAGLAIGGRPVTPLAARALMQIVFLVAVLAAGFAPGAVEPVSRSQGPSSGTGSSSSTLSATLSHRAGLLRLLSHNP